jgi:uncharacterized protein (TIGR03086 family)
MIASCVAAAAAPNTSAAGIVRSVRRETGAFQNDRNPPGRSRTPRTLPRPPIRRANIAEMVLHGWDAAKASGQHYTAPDDVAGAVLTAVEANAELYRTYQGFADPVPVPASASALERALAQSGRDPAWAPIS